MIKRDILMGDTRLFLLSGCLDVGAQKLPAEAELAAALVPTGANVGRVVILVDEGEE